MPFAVTASLLFGPVHAQSTITLEQCLQESLEANHSLLGLDAEGAAARARATGATAARRPRMYLESSVLHSTDPLRVRPARFNGETGAYEQDLWQGFVGTSMPLYAGGRLAAEEAAAQLLADAANADLIFARQTLAVRVLAVYEDALATGAIVHSLQQSLAALRSQQQRTEALVRQEKAAGVDVLRVAVRVARVEQSLIEAESRLETLKGTLAVLMGREPSSDWMLAGALSSRDVTPAVPAGTRAATRADEVAAQARVDAAIQQQASARASSRPAVNATVNWGPRGSFEGDRYEWGFAGLVFTWSFADFGRTSAKVAEAHALRRAREEAASQASLQRRLEQANAEVALRAAVARIDASQSAVTQARESLRIEQLRYDLGDGAIVDVLDAQAAADEAASLRARALADYNIALAALDLARGVVFSTSATSAALQSDPLN